MIKIIIHKFWESSLDDKQIFSCSLCEQHVHETALNDFNKDLLLLYMYEVNKPNAGQI